MNCGKSVKIALAMSGENTNWIAEQLGISRQAASNLTRNKVPTGTTIVKLANLFDLKCSEFIALGED